jgi:hypothetical protein
MESIVNFTFIPLSYKIALSVQSHLHEAEEKQSAMQTVHLYTKLAAGAFIGAIESLFFFTLKHATKELCKHSSRNPHIQKLQAESESGFKRSQEIFNTIKKIFDNCFCIASSEKIEIPNPKSLASKAPQSLFEIDPIEGKNQYPEFISSVCEIAVQRIFHYAPEFLKSSNDAYQEDASFQSQGKNNIAGITPEALRGVAVYAQLIEIMQITSQQSLYQNLDWQRKNPLFLARSNLQKLDMQEKQILLTKLLLGDEADSLVESLPSNSRMIINELNRQVGQLAHAFISPNTNASIYQAFIDGYQQGLTVIPIEE